MATLLELATIETNSTAEPDGDPTAVPPVADDPAILAARDLRSRIRMATVDHALRILTTPLPTGDARGQAVQEIAWAQAVVLSPDQAAGVMLRLALVQAPTTATVAQILAPSDTAILNNIAPLIPLLATGLQPGRR